MRWDDRHLTWPELYQLAGHVESDPATDDDRNLFFRVIVNRKDRAWCVDITHH